MTSHPYESLRNRLVLPFVLIGYLVSSLLSLITLALVADLEERAVRRMLHVEMESFRKRVAVNPDIDPVSASLLQGHFLPDPQFANIAFPSPDTERVELLTIDEVEYSVLVEEIGGRPFALLYDRSYLKGSLAKLALSLLILTAAMTLLSYLVANRLAGKLVRPISRLLDDIAEKSTLAQLQDTSLSFSAAEYPNNEIGRLVQGIEQFARRLYGFLQRESHFAADVSHELRTPIAVIRGAAEVLVENPDLPGPVRQKIETIHRHAARSAEILEAMLLLAREESDDGDPNCAIAEVVRDVVADCTPLLKGRPVALLAEISASPILAVERSLAYVVVSNLVRNACAHTREGSIAVRLDASGIEIADTGIGIPEDRFPDLFRRHVKGEDSSGHGLGLSIVSRITERLGWPVAVVSRPGSGTRIRVGFAAAAN